MKYYLDYLRSNRSNDRTFSSYQVILMIESLLTCKSLDDLISKQSQNDFNSDILDLATIVTILTTSKSPQVTDIRQKNSVTIEEIKKPEAVKSVSSINSINNTKKDLEFSMDNLVTAFLNQSFNNGSMASQSLVSIDKQSKMSEKSLDRIKDLELIVPSSFPSSYLAKEPKEILSHYAKKYFHLYNGIKIIFDECEATMSLLNSFRMKTFKEIDQGIKVIIELSEEEALNAKNK